MYEWAYFVHFADNTAAFLNVWYFYFINYSWYVPTWVLQVVP